MITFDDLGKAEFVSIESFRKNGTSVRTPVWITPDNGKLYCWTGSDSWKVKRVRNNSSVNLAICDREGNIESEWVSAHAIVQDDPAHVKTQTQRMAKRFGLMFRMFQFMGIVRQSKYVAIEFTPVTETTNVPQSSPTPAQV